VESSHEESKIESFRKRLDEEFTIKGTAIVIPQKQDIESAFK
jgi:hypothetical protein